MKILNSSLSRFTGLAMISAFLWVQPAFAQVKLATVDMKKVFDSYYKTKEAEARIKERAASSDKVYKSMIEDYQKANEEYRGLVESSNDAAISEDERDRRKKLAETKIMEIQEIEKQVKQFQGSARDTIGALEKRMRDDIVREIREIVNNKARAGNFTMVLDTAAQTVYQTPFILYHTTENDLTDAVIRDLNANAPAGAVSDAGAGTAPGTR